MQPGRLSRSAAPPRQRLPPDTLTRSGTRCCGCRWRRARRDAGAPAEATGTPPRSSAVIQTQIILAVIGAVVMLVVGATLARAFGVVGAAGLVRYRAKIEDPKDAGVMLSALAVGLASRRRPVRDRGRSRRSSSCLLWVIESFEPEGQQAVRAEDQDGGGTDELRQEDRRDPAQISCRLRPAHLVRRGGVLRGARCRSSCERDRVTNALLTLDPEGHAAVDGRKRRTSQVANVKLIIQPERRRRAGRAGHRKREEDDRHRHLPLRPPRAREGARRGGRARRRRARADRAHQSRAARRTCASSSCGCSRPAPRWRGPPTTCRATTAR